MLNLQFLPDLITSVSMRQHCSVIVRRNDDKIYSDKFNKLNKVSFLLFILATFAFTFSYFLTILLYLVTIYIGWLSFNRICFPFVSTRYNSKPVIVIVSMYRVYDWISVIISQQCRT